MPHTPGHKDKKKSSDGTTPQEALTAILDLFRQAVGSPMNSPMGALTSSIGVKNPGDVLKNIFANPGQNLNPNLPSPGPIDRNFMDNYLLRNREGAMLPATFLDALVDRIMERVRSEGGGPMGEAMQNLMNTIGSRTMQGLEMQSGVPGMVGQESPSLPNRNPSFDLGPPPIMSPKQVANFAQRSSGVPGTAAYQKDQRLQDPRLDAFMMAGMRPGDTFSNSPLPPQLMNPNLGSVPFGQNTAMSPQEFANFVSKTQGLKDQSRQTYTPGM